MTLLKWLFLVLLAIPVTVLAVDTSSGAIAQQWPHLQTQSLFNNVVVFGDSFSDNGNAAELTHGLYPGGRAYATGRFSDGPTWVEYLTMQLGLQRNNPGQLLDFAYGQAQINGPYILHITQGKKNLTYTIPDLSQQITDYLRHPVPHPQESLFIVFIGANDFLNLAATTEPSQLMEKMITQQMQQIHRLINHGAKHLLVINMRDLTLSPYASTLAAEHSKSHPSVSPEDYKNNYRQLIMAYNQLLAKQISSNHHLLLFDSFAFDNKVLQAINEGGFSYTFNGKTYRLKYSKKPCYINKGNYQEQVSAICKNAYEYFFYDRVHPTTYAHKIMADAVYQYLNSKYARSLK